MTTLLNFTPHAVTICNAAGDEIIRTIPSAGSARVASTQRILPALDGIPMTVTDFGDVTGLPEPAPDTIYIVSDFVLRASPRTDLVRPDTGPTCVRKDGLIWAVRGLTR